MTKINMAAFAAECFLPENVRKMVPVAEDKEQEPAEVQDHQDPQPSAAPNFAAIAAECFLPKG